MAGKWEEMMIRWQDFHFIDRYPGNIIEAGRNSGLHNGRHKMGWHLISMVREKAAKVVEGGCLELYIIH